MQLSVGAPRIQRASSGRQTEARTVQGWRIVRGPGAPAPPTAPSISVACRWGGRNILEGGSAQRSADLDEEEGSTGPLAPRGAEQNAAEGHLTTARHDMEASTSMTAKPPLWVDPDVRIVTRMRQQQQQGNQPFWGGFMDKCRRAADIFFPKQEVLTPARAVSQRLRWVLVSDRSGMGLPTLLQIQQSTLSNLMGTNEEALNAVELELQVNSVKTTGERVTISVPLLDLTDRAVLRDPKDYHYEDGDLEQPASNIVHMEEEEPESGSYAVTKGSSSSRV